MDIQTIEMLAIGVIALLGFKALWGSKTKTDEDGRIKDESVTIKNVLECLSSFDVILEKNLKEGYTEKSIQKQLKKHLLNHFVHVISEYGIEGANSTQIDFDIGEGMVGLELKLASKILKTSEFNRLIGQIETYSKRKYTDDNIIIAIYGEKKHTQERAMLKEIRERVEEKNVEYAYYEIPSLKVKKTKK